MTILPRTAIALALLALATGPACSDDTSTSNEGGSGGSGPIGGGGSVPTTGGAPPSDGGGGGTGGIGGSGGSFENVDPLEGIGDVTTISDEFDFTEGAVWVPALGVVRFSDIPNNRIHELDPGSGEITIWREPSNNTNGNGLAPDGDIVMCEHSGRRVSRSPATGPVDATSVADTYEGMQFNSPNDVIIRSDGQVYFTDPTYGLEGGNQEIPFQGVFRVDLQGDVHLVGDEYGQPNGIALSPDETKLYVTDSQDGGLYVYDVAADGATGERTLLIDAEPSDGMAVDDAGNLYLTTGAGVEVYRADGTPWGVIVVPQQPANCTFGGADRRTLYITARTGFYAVALNVPGLP